MSRLLVALVLLSLAVCISSFTCTQKDFDDFKVQYKKSYATQEEHNRRFKIFCENKLEAEKLDAKHPETQFGVTKFSDLTQQEFRSFYLGTKVPDEPLPDRPDGSIGLPDAPDYFDWRYNSSKQVITDPYNQEQCGSCWSFSATETIETKWALAGNDLISLSMQQMVDCDTTDGGCGGGWPYKAFEYIINAPGQMLFSDYPYTAQQGYCQFDSSRTHARISSWEYAGTNDENKMASYLSSVGPISVCVDASQWSYYNGGIFPASQCTSGIDHAVLAVGYNLNGGYWIIRNSWGADWGIGGYIYIPFGVNACSVASYAVSAVV